MCSNQKIQSSLIVHWTLTMYPMCINRKKFWKHKHILPQGTAEKCSYIDLNVYNDLVAKSKRKKFTCRVNTPYPGYWFTLRLHTTHWLCIVIILIVVQSTVALNLTWKYLILKSHSASEYRVARTQNFDRTLLATCGMSCFWICEIMLQQPLEQCIQSYSILSTQN